MCECIPVSYTHLTAVNEVIFDQISKSGDANAKAGVIVIGQAKGDVHDIGKNVCSALLACNGFEVHDLGIDVPVKKFYDTALELNADIVAMSTLQMCIRDRAASTLPTIRWPM